MDPYSRPFSATGLKDEGVGRKGRLGWRQPGCYWWVTVLHKPLQRTTVKFIYISVNSRRRWSICPGAQFREVPKKLRNQDTEYFNECESHMRAGGKRKNQEKISILSIFKICLFCIFCWVFIFCSLKYFIKILFTPLITELFGTCLNFVTKVHSSFT